MSLFFERRGMVAPPSPDAGEPPANSPGAPFVIWTGDRSEVIDVAQATLMISV